MTHLRHCAPTVLMDLLIDIYVSAVVAVLRNPRSELSMRRQDNTSAYLIRRMQPIGHSADI